GCTSATRTSRCGRPPDGCRDPNSGSRCRLLPSLSVGGRSRLPPSGSRLHRRGIRKGKAGDEGRMPSELDRKYDAVLAHVTGPEGSIQLGRDAKGRVIVTNLPGTLPILFDAFCMLHGATVAIVAGEERLTFAELDTQATKLAHVLAGGWGVRKGDRVAIAMRNCPAWIVAYMAALKAGGVATLINGWWTPD